MIKNNYKVWCEVHRKTVLILLLQHRIYPRVQLSIVEVLVSSSCRWTRIIFNLDSDFSARSIFFTSSGFNYRGKIGSLFQHVLWSEILISSFKISAITNPYDEYFIYFLTVEHYVTQAALKGFMACILSPRALPKTSFCSKICPSVGLLMVYRCRHC